MGWRARGLLVGLIALNTWLLSWVEVSLFQQLQTWAALFLLTSAGAALLARARPHFPDRVTFVAVGFLVGSSCSVALHYLFLGPVGEALLGGRSLQFVSRLSLGILGAVGVVGLWRTRATAPLPSAHGTSTVLIAALAFGMAVSTSYGHYNNMQDVDLRAPSAPVKGQRNWGWSADWHVHFGQRYRQLKTGDLTPRLGTPMLAASCIPFGQEGVWRTGKALIWPFYFALLYLFYSIAMEAFGLSRRLALLTAASVVLFAPLNVSFLFGDLRASYRGLLSGGGTFTHNATQLMSFTIGLGAVFLIWLRLRHRTPTTAWAAVLIAASFSFKPSFFSIAAPTMILFIAGARRWPNRDECLAIAVLFSIPVMFAIHLLTGGATNFLGRPDEPSGEPARMRPALMPFHVLFEWSQRWPTSVREEPLLLGTLIVFSSLALMILAAMVYAWASTARGRSGTLLSEDARPRGPARLLTGGCLMLFALGIASGTLLAIDDPRLIRNGDFLWATGQGIMLVMPVTIAVVAGVRIALLRRFLWLLLALHLASGCVNLWLYAVEHNLS